MSRALNVEPGEFLKGVVVIGVDQGDPVQAGAAVAAAPDVGLVKDDHLRAQLCRLDRRKATRQTAANDQDVCADVLVTHVTSPFASQAS